MLRSEASASHEIAFRPLVDLSFPKMNGPLLASVPKKAYSRTEIVHRCDRRRSFKRPGENILEIIALKLSSFTQIKR